MTTTLPIHLYSKTIETGNRYHLYTGNILVHDYDLPGGGHIVDIEAPDAGFDDIVNFLEGHRAGFAQSIRITVRADRNRNGEPLVVQTSGPSFRLQNVDDIRTMKTMLDIAETFAVRFA